MWLDPKYKYHVTGWGPESRSFHVWWTSPDLSFLRAGAFVTAHLKGSRQRQEVPWQLPQMPRSWGCPSAGSLPCPWSLTQRKCRAWSTSQLRNKLLWVLLFKKQMVCSLPFGVVDRQADVGGFICVSGNGQVELGIWRDFWYFLLSIRLNTLKDDLYLDILPLPLLILMWKTKQRNSWKREVEKKKRCWSFSFSISGKGMWSLRGLAVQPGYYFIPYKSRVLSLCSVKLSSPLAFF